MLSHTQHGGFSRHFASLACLLLIFTPSMSQACDETIPIKQTHSSTLEVTVKNNIVKVCPQVDQPLSESQEAGVSKNANEPESNSAIDSQSFTLIFDQVYVATALKIRSSVRRVRIDYSRPQDPKPYGRMYKVLGGSSTITLNDGLPPSIFFGNKLEPAFVANSVKFTLVDILDLNDGQCLSLRFLSGVCEFPAIQSYTIPEPTGEFQDIAYDGVTVGGRLKGGLGLLVLPDMKQPFSGAARFLEWSREKFSKVELGFEFAVKQNMSSVRMQFAQSASTGSAKEVTCYSMFNRDSDISRGVVRTQSIPVNAQSVMVTLNFIARSVHCELKFSDDSDYIRLRNLAFKSRNATAAEIEKVSPNVNDNSGNSGGDSGNGDNTDSGSGGGVKPNDPEGGFGGAGMQYLTVIIAVMAVLCGVVLTFVCIGAVAIYYRRKKLQLKKKYESAYSKAEFFGSGLPPEIPYQAVSQLDQYETPRYHASTTLDIAGGSASGMAMGMGGGRQLPDLPQYQSSQSPYQAHDVGSLASSRIYTEPDLVSQLRDREQNTLTRGGGDSLARNIARAYAETDISQIQDDLWSGIFGGTFEMSNVLEYQKSNLIFLKELGKGQFAIVHLCVAPGILDGNPDSAVKVAVKFLHPDAVFEQREAFKKEVKVLSDLRHPNIIQLYGVSTRSGPPMMILEFMENGDLYQFLRRHEPELASYASSSNIQTLSAETLIRMGVQIAAGMAHVESVNFIHRDLASRNCLVGISDTVKIGDFGMSRELYTNDYYKIEGKAVLPIRWMAWESIVMGKFSNKSDVWSFGVLMWELFTLAKCQPFSNRSDEQVIENLTNIWENKGSETLPQPGNCPESVFQLMLSCWKNSPSDRPNFHNIHAALETISAAYDSSTNNNTNDPPVAV